MVGDNFEADIVGAQEVGMQSIWITRRIENALHEASGMEPDAVVSTLGEIPALLAGNSRGHHIDMPRASYFPGG